MVEKFKKISFSENNLDLQKVSLKDLEKERCPVILDTNFLFVTFEFKVDVVRELERLLSTGYKLYIFEGTLKELQVIEDKKDKNRKYLKLISTFLHIYNVSIIESNEKYVDRDLLSLPKGIYVATNDKELKERLRKKFIDVVYLRQKKYLEVN